MLIGYYFLANILIYAPIIKTIYLGMIATLFTTLLITKYWKISLHMAAIGGCFGVFLSIQSIYGEVIDKILRETSTKAIDEKKIKVAGQPKIDLKTFGEGKDLNYELQIDSLPEIILKPFENYKATEYKVKIEDKIVNDKLIELSSQNKQFEDKKDDEKAKLGDQVIFDYSAQQI